MNLLLYFYMKILAQALANIRNCILIDYVPSHQGRAAIHRPECSFRSVECMLIHNNNFFPFLHLLFIYLFNLRPTGVFL